MGRKNDNDNTKRGRKITSKYKNRDNTIYNAKHVRIAEKKAVQQASNQKKNPKKK